MSSLNLVPNPTVLIVQTGIFLVNAVVAKKFILEPFIRVHKQRYGATKGSQELAIKLEEDNKTKTQGITFKIQEAASSAHKMRDEIVSKARNEKDLILKKAENEAREYLDAMSKEIKAQIENERTKIPSIVVAMTSEVYQQTIN